MNFLVTRGSGPDIAGRYADAPRYVLTETGRHAFPPPLEVPSLMGDFAAWLTPAPASRGETAFTAHRRLVDIHPFNDGDGCTARLLMNLILIRGGYPPVALRPEYRLEYLQGLQEAQAGGSPTRLETLCHATGSDLRHKTAGPPWPCANWWKQHDGLTAKKTDAAKRGSVLTTLCPLWRVTCLVSKRLRALFANDEQSMRELAAAWPDDVRDHAIALAFRDDQQSSPQTS